MDVDESFKTHDKVGEKLNQNQRISAKLRKKHNYS